VPARLADTWVAQGTTWGHDWARPINEATDKALAALAERLGRWELTPTGTEGYAKAEVTAGGVDTRALSGQTMESRQPGLYFIGEVVDVTGWLGGYNFQWAWASAFACAKGLKAKLLPCCTLPRQLKVQGHIDRGWNHRHLFRRYARQFDSWASFAGTDGPNSASAVCTSFQREWAKASKTRQCHRAKVATQIAVVWRRTRPGFPWHVVTLGTGL
jgi:hypothetical protein